MAFTLRRPPFRTYTITQLCREFGATPRALRFYEEQGLLSPARRDTARVYSYKDRARLQLILRGRRVGLSIAARGAYAHVDQIEAREPGSNLEPVGPDAGLTAMPRYLNNRAASIYGGSNEIQRDIIARLVLGL